VISVALAALGMAIGSALPRSTTASVLILVAAIVTLVAIALRAESVAPSHGLQHIVRLPARAAVSASVESCRSRIVGTARNLWRRAPDAASAPDIETDDEAEAWWGAQDDRDPVMVSVTIDANDTLSGPSRGARMRERLHRHFAGITRSFTRRTGDTHVAGDSASSDDLEGSTFSTGSA
jgi:hypothetical protein